MSAWTKIRQFHRRGRKPLRADQRGFTLLEVLIAMFILAIIAVPICRVYVQAARTNAKARKQASATAVAENTMEGINAFSYEDVVKQFDPVLTPDGEFLICQNVAPGGRVLMGGGLGEDGRAVYALKGVHEDVYDFDVRVTIDPSVYARENELEAPKVNDYELVSMAGYNSAKDYLYVLEEGSLRSRYGLEYDTVYNQVNRKLQLTVTKEGAGDDAGIVVSMKAAYWRNGEPEPTSDAMLEPCGAQRFEGEDALRSVYLCYEPNYAAGYGSGKDQIEIINMDNVEFDLYLIKQSCPTWSDLGVREEMYAPEVTVREGQWASDDQGSYVQIYHNYGTNLAADESHAAIDPEISDVKASYHYRYRDTAGNPGSADGKQSDTDLSQTLHIGSSAVHKEKRFRMFSVTVEIYEAGAFDEDFDGSTKPRITVLSNQ